MQFANFLESKVCEKDISINRLSNETGVSRKSIYRWLAGEKYPDAKNVIAIGSILELDSKDTSMMLQCWIKDKELQEIIKLYLDTTLLVTLN